MRLDDTQESGNVEDRRGMHPAMKIGGGGGILAILVVLIGAYFGVDLRQLIGPNSPLGNVAPQTQQQTGPVQTDPAEDKLASFAKKVLKTTEDVWTDIFREQNIGTYEKPVMQLFSGRTQTACGGATAAVGPFYCPGDHKLYIDLSFYGQLARDLNSPGDFAQAYVIAHEVGHHVQNLLGTSDKVDQARRRLSEKEFNRVSVRLELQADFYAGVWANRSGKRLEPGDIEEALNAANHIGDDALQKQGQGYVVPDSFTHGTSAQRMKWFKKGFQTGDIHQGDTFSVRDEDL